MLFATPEFKVGLLIVTVSIVVGAMSLKVAEGPGILGGSKTYHFTVDNASGLIPNSSVKMAGIKVGVIDKIHLVNGRARIEVSVDGDVVLTTSTGVELKSDGILGDRHVALTRGQREDPVLPNGAEIQRTKDTSGTDQIMGEVGKITDSLAELTDRLNRATQPGGDPDSVLGRIFLNLDKLMVDLSEVAGQNRSKVNNIIDHLDQVATSLSELLDQESDVGLYTSVERLDRTLENLEEITDKVNKGEGTIGRLVNDEETVQELNMAISNVNNFLGGATEMETSIHFQSAYQFHSDQTKSILNLRLQPGLDRYYELGVVDTPEGTLKATETTTIVGDVSTTSEELKVFKNKLKFNALFAKNFYNFTLKGGMIESAGGFGADYYLFRKRLKLSAEVFDFSDLNVRSSLSYQLFKGAYFIGGGERLTQQDSTFFVGGGLFITNDDLKMFASQLSL